MFFLPALIVLAIPVAVVAQAEPEAPPPLFSKITFADAVKQNENTDKVLVVKATAAWCGPCKQMDKTTWRDEKVVAWFKENGVAIQFDVDADPRLARTLRIEAMPTMIAFRSGKEFDRVVGYKSADDLLAWTIGVRRGERSIEAVRSRARAAQGGDEGIQARYDLARALVNQNELDKATDEYVWLWQNTDGTSFTGVRGSFMASDMTRLAQRHPGAMTRFIGMRDDVGKHLAGEKVDYNDLDDWIVLNAVVAQEDATLTWFDQHKGEQRWQPLIRRVSFRLENLLEAKERWGDLGALYRSPIAELQQAEQMKAMMLTHGGGEDDELKALTKEYAEQSFREKAAKVYIAMLHAGREGDARAVTERAVKQDDTPEMRRTLVRWAVRTGQPRPEQTALLDQAGDGPETDLRQSLQTALDQKK